MRTRRGAHAQATSLRREVCALRQTRVVLNNNTVRIGRQIIDIPRNARRSTCANCLVQVHHLLSGQYRVYFQGRLIERAKGTLPEDSPGSPRLPARWRERQVKGKGVTESLTCDIADDFA